MAEASSVTPTEPLAGVAPEGVAPHEQSGEGESLLTVVLAFAANLLVAVAKSVAAAVTGSASMLAEAAHSWADAGNEVFLLVAQKRARKPPDDAHPLGHGREIYVWSLFAAIGLFAIGAGVSITHGVQELIHPEPAASYGVAYLVLGISALLEGVSFVQAARQVRRAASRSDQPLSAHLLATSDPTVRAVFFEDAAALIGLAIAAIGVALHQATGSVVPDAVGSILVGVLLAVVAVLLIDRNRRFLVGENADPRLRDAAVRSLLELPEIERVTQLRLEIVGPRRIFLTGAVDLTGNPVEDEAAHTLAVLERRLAGTPGVAGALLSLSEADEPSIGTRTPAS